MPETSGVEKVVRSAWGRRLLVVAVERTAIAATVVLGAFVAMLLVGTQVLDGRWLFLLAAVGLGIAGYQVRQRLLGHYRVAQILDKRLQLADSLSTAWYLLTRPGQQRDAVTDYQIKGAERAARRVDLAAAFPFTGRRPWAIAGALALAAGGLFGVRYFVTNSLSLQPSLLPFQLSEVFERSDKESSEAKRQREEAGTDAQRGQKDAQKTDGQKDAKEPPRAEAPQLAQGNAEGAGQNPNEPSEMREAKDSQDKQQSGDAAGSAEQKPGDKQGDSGDKKAGEQKPSSNDEANSPKSSNSMLDRMKDALSSLASKMRPNQGKQGRDQQSGDDQKGNPQNGSKDENSKSQQAAANREASEQQQASDGQAKGQTQEKSRAGQGKSAEQSADKSKSDAHSGIGSQDGDKTMRDAEQLKAMGKLAEIIGQRSARATGDVMVENPSGKQQLQTDYSRRLGRHENLGGEINRDEIPLMYQQYIREYMSEVRQQAKRHKEADGMVHHGKSPGD